MGRNDIKYSKWIDKLNDFINKKVIIPHVREYEILNEILN